MRFYFCNCTIRLHFLSSVTLHISTFLPFGANLSTWIKWHFKETFNSRKIWLSLLHKLKYMIIKCPPFLHNDTNATWFATANYLLIFWESLASFKKRFGICMPVSGRMKVVLLDPYRAEDTELSATSKFKHVSICRQWMHHWHVLCLVSYDIFYIPICSFWGVCRIQIYKIVSFWHFSWEKKSLMQQTGIGRFAFLCPGGLSCLNWSMIDALSDFYTWCSTRTVWGVWEILGNMVSEAHSRKYLQ